MKFAANVSTLFTEVGFLDRFDRARRAGFDAVEFWWPTGDAAAVAAAARAAAVQVALFNFDAGDMARGDRGLISDPARRDRFRAHVPIALELAQAVGCSQINALAGLESDEVEPAEQLALAVDNARFAADAAAAAGIKVLIEPINRSDNGPYLLPDVQSARAFIASVARPNVFLQYDIYHAQRTEGNIGSTLRRYISDIAHIQIADVPGRGEPGTGEIAYDWVLREIDALGYGGYVGLEYRPTTAATEESLKWMERFT